jgi:histone chaperone ASF1
MVRRPWTTSQRTRLILTFCRDSEESAPAEFPPDQPEADTLEDDQDKYGAEEIELEEALIKEEAALKAEEDEDMAGAEDTAGPGEKMEEDDESDAASEDLEAESSGSEDEEEEGEGEEEGGDEDMEMDDGDSKPAPQGVEQQHSEVMVH